MTPVIALRAFVDQASLTFAMLVDRRQEYLPRRRHRTGAASGTDTAVDSSANWPRNEMTFERVAPTCYLREPFSVSLEQSASASPVLDEMPAEDMHRAVWKISQVYAEIYETAERIVASSPRQLGHGREADGMSAGG